MYLPSELSQIRRILGILSIGSQRLADVHTDTDMINWLFKPARSHG